MEGLLSLLRPTRELQSEKAGSGYARKAIRPASKFIPVEENHANNLAKGECDLTLFKKNGIETTYTKKRRVFLCYNHI